MFLIIVWDLFCSELSTVPNHGAWTPVFKSKPVPDHGVRTPVLKTKPSSRSGCEESSVSELARSRSWGGTQVLITKPSSRSWC